MVVTIIVVGGGPGCGVGGPGGGFGGPGGGFSGSRSSGKPLLLLANTSWCSLVLASTS